MSAKRNADAVAFVQRSANIRDPDNAPAPADIEERRMAIYRSLFFNNVSNFLATAYPTLSKILGDDGWRALMREYYRDHASQTPLFTEMAEEFNALSRAFVDEHAGG